MKQPVDPVKHVLVLYKFATVGLGDSPLHSSDEAGLLFEHASDSVFHQLLGILTIGRGHLLESRFNFRREMYFHAFKIRENRREGNERCTFRMPEQVSSSAERGTESRISRRVYITPDYLQTCGKRRRVLSKPPHVREILRVRTMPLRISSLIVVFGAACAWAQTPLTIPGPTLRRITADDMKVKLDAATRERVIEGVIANLNEYYVYPDTAMKMIDAVRAQQKSGAYSLANQPTTFAMMLTKDLQDVSRDRHLSVGYSFTVLPEGRIKPTSDAYELAEENCSFQKAERLPSNIGYLKINAFRDPEICGATATAAMNFLGNVDAMIFDLRDNGGGAPGMVVLISTYLFNQPTHLNDVYNRKEDSTTQYWTLPYVPGKRLAGKPVFVLTSKRTFSGAEEFAYDLKNLKRATIIGETTGGGAHMVSVHRLDDHFMIGVPVATAVNPISKANWEGSGVEPDVKVPAEEALDVAERMAAEKIIHGH